MQEATHKERAPILTHLVFGRLAALRDFDYDGISSGGLRPALILLRSIDAMPCRRSLASPGSVIVPWHPETHRDALVFDRHFEHAAVCQLADMGAVKLLPGRLADEFRQL